MKGARVSPFSLRPLIRTSHRVSAADGEMRAIPAATRVEIEGCETRAGSCVVGLPALAVLPRFRLPDELSSGGGEASRLRTN